MSRERADAELLAEARRDLQAFGELYTRHVAAVHDWRAADPLGRSRPDRGDVRPGMARHRRRFRDRREGTALPWLLGIARNVWTYLVDARRFAPIEWRSRQGRGTVVLSLEVYETLAATNENDALVSLTAQHPDAPVDNDPAYFDAAPARLSPARP